MSTVLLLTAFGIGWGATVFALAQIRAHAPDEAAIRDQFDRIEYEGRRFYFTKFRNGGSE